MLAEESMNYIFKIIFFTFFSITFSYQTTTLKGIVLDEENNPINNVYISSETGYAETNNDGAFMILYKDKKEVLTFKIIGYKTEKFSVEYLLKKSGNWPRSASSNAFDSRPADALMLPFNISKLDFIAFLGKIFNKWSTYKKYNNH